MVSQASLPIEENFYRHTSQLDMLHDFALQINSNHNIQNILKTSTGKICEIMQADECYISFCDDPDYETKLEKATKQPKRDNKVLLSAPILAKGRKIGFLAVLGKKTVHYDRRDRQFLMMLGSHLGLAVANADVIAELQKAVVLDPLTEAYNYRYFRDELELNLRSSMNSPNSLVLIDVNDFKPINDNFGHPVGDQILIETAKILKDNVRLNDTVSRNGGDEFALILPGADAEETTKIMKRIESAFEEYRHYRSGTEIRISLSWGAVTTYNRLTDIDRFIGLADEQLYKMKRSKKPSSCPYT